ncbi:MAG: hypothetical protein WA989_14245, partial [Henriciella sp.]
MTERAGDIQRETGHELDLTPAGPSVDDGGSDSIAEATCHGGAETLRDAAKKAGKHTLLEQYAKDYPTGPHDQPQSMCPAFGSLRVGLRMKRTATIL